MTSIFSFNVDSGKKTDGTRVQGRPDPIRSISVSVKESYGSFSISDALVLTSKGFVKLAQVGGTARVEGRTIVVEPKEGTTKIVGSIKIEHAGAT